MKTFAKKSLLVGARGEPLFHEPRAYSNTGFYNTPQNTGQNDYFKPRPAAAISGNISEGDWQAILGYARQLFAQVGTLGAAIVQKGTYAVGDSWKPQYFGEDAKWGAEAEAWLAERFYPVCDVRGPSYDFVTNLFLSSVALDVDGDIAMILTEAESGFPQIQFVSSHRIGSRHYGDKVKGGPYDGASIRCGVIFNESGRPIAYNILGATEKDDVQVSADDCQLLFEPEWQFQSRGISRIGRVLLDWMNHQDVDLYQMRGIKLDSSEGLVHYTESGLAPTASDILTARTDTDATIPTALSIEKREGGEIRYMRAGVGERIEAFKSERPHPNTEAFLERIERGGLLAVGWFRELIDPSKVGGSSVRLIQDQARHSIRQRQKTIRKLAKRAVIYAVAKAMKHGFLRRSSDWFYWDFETPAEITVDEGYSRAADVEDLKLGLTTKAAIASKNGKWFEDIGAQRGRELRDLIKEAKAIAAESGLPLEYVMERLEQRSPNPAPIMQPPAPVTK